QPSERCLLVIEPRLLRGLAAMTIHTAHVALRDLPLDGPPCGAVRYEPRDVVGLLAADVVELEDVGVSFAAVYASPRADVLPSATSAASRNGSASVGCAWIVAATSSTVASRRIASVASAMSSLACGPAMCTPTMRPSFPAVTIFVTPSTSPSASARPDARNGK